MKTSGLGRFTLGQPLPARAHAVCVSLPKFEDVIGYEEKNPATLQSMPTGYPRFVRHQMINRMIEHLDESTGQDTKGYLFYREQDCREVIERYQINGFQLSSGEQWTLLQLPSNSSQNNKVVAHFQHTGCGVSSRLAEDYLWDRGLIEARETLSEIPNAEDIILETISQAHGPEVRSEDLLLTSSGANAFHALFQSATKQAKAREKVHLDTMGLVISRYHRSNEFVRLQERRSDRDYSGWRHRKIS